MINTMVNNFVTDVIDGSCRLAHMRNSNEVDVQDLSLYLSTRY